MSFSFFHCLGFCLAASIALRSFILAQIKFWGMHLETLKIFFFWYVQEYILEKYFYSKNV